MLAIEGNFVRYDGRLWNVHSFDGDCVHLVTGGDGVCVEVDDPVLFAALELLPRAA